MPSKGNPHLRTRVDPVLNRLLRAYAIAHHTTVAKLVREIVAEWVFERVDHTPLKRVDHTLHRLDVLSKQLQLELAVLPAKEAGELTVAVAGHVTVPGQKEPPHEEPVAGERVDTVKQRETMYWLVVAMLKEAQKLSENEALAKNAGSRMAAMKVAGEVARVGEALLGGYDRAYIQPYLDELEELIEQFKDRSKQADQKGQKNPPRSTA